MERFLGALTLPFLPFLPFLAFGSAIGSAFGLAFGLAFALGFGLDGAGASALAVSPAGVRPVCVFLGSELGPSAAAGRR